LFFAGSSRRGSLWKQGLSTRHDADRDGHVVRHLGKRNQVAS
jgi:hypothetical protein